MYITVRVIDAGRPNHGCPNDHTGPKLVGMYHRAGLQWTIKKATWAGPGLHAHTIESITTNIYGHIKTTAIFNAVLPHLGGGGGEEGFGQSCQVFVTRDQ